MQGRTFKTQKKTTIVQVHERSIVFRQTQSSVVWCPKCADKQVMVRPEMAAALSLQNIGAIYEMIDAGRIHIRADDNVLLVCVASIPRSR